MFVLTKLLFPLVASFAFGLGGGMSTFSPFFSGTSTGAAASALAGLEDGETLLWAGHEVIEGTKQIPVIGKLKTRTETYSLARVRADPNVPGGLVLDAEACRVSFKKVAGIGVAMDATKLPRSRVKFRPDGADGAAVRGKGVVRWGKEDVDRDGKPGAAVTVNSTMCGGTLHVSNESRISMRSEAVSSEGMKGSVNVRVTQSILEAEGRCLSRMAKDESASSKGRFAYKRVAAGSTCSALLRQGWPVRAK